MFIAAPGMYPEKHKKIFFLQNILFISVSELSSIRSDGKLQRERSAELIYFESKHENHLQCGNYI